MRRSFARSIARVAGLGLLCAVGAFVAGCASTPSGGGANPEFVRVLLYDGVGPISVGPGGFALRMQSGSLLVDGEPVGAHWQPSGRGPWTVGERRVRGQVRVEARADRLQVLNRVGLEDYVASTVGGEMPTGWPDAALRAQAVASRTYVLHEAQKRRARRWDVRATTASQVYRGIGAETPETRQATRATRGEVLTHGGQPILAVFHSTSGGRTATAGEVWGRDLPYLQVVEVEDEDDAPHTYWRKEIAHDALRSILPDALVAVGAVAGSEGGAPRLEVAERTASGRVARLRISGPEGSLSVSGADLRGLVRALGLRSTLFDVRATEGGVAFVGSGFGHGVGMSQWGARALAERGEPYARILARFYPGARLVRRASGGDGRAGPAVASDRTE